MSEPDLTQTWLPGAAPRHQLDLRTLRLVREAIVLAYCAGTCRGPRDCEPAEYPADSVVVRDILEQARRMFPDRYPALAALSDEPSPVEPERPEPAPDAPPELYWSPVHGLIYRTDPGTLGDGRYVAWQPGGRYLNDGLPADAVRLVAGRLAAQLPVIPGGFKLYRDRVAFLKYEDEWHLIGPAAMLPTGQLVLVERFSEPDDQEVLVGAHVAERTVRHADGETVTYAIAKIDRGDNR